MHSDDHWCISPSLWELVIEKIALLQLISPHVCLFEESASWELEHMSCFTLLTALPDHIWFCSVFANICWSCHVPTYPMSLCPSPTFRSSSQPLLFKNFRFLIFVETQFHYFSYSLPICLGVKIQWEPFI